MQYSKNIETVIEILKDEVLGRTVSAIEKTRPDYKMTWVYQKKSGDLFPSATMSSGENALEDVYQIKGRIYEIMNIAESEHVVMIELIESYPDPKTYEMYKTPLVLVLEFENGTIKTGRHYCDPALSYANLSGQQLDDLYRGRKPLFVIKE